MAAVDKSTILLCIWIPEILLWPSFSSLNGEQG